MKPSSFSKLWQDRFPGWRATFTPTDETTPEMTREEALAAAQPKIEANLAAMIKHIDDTIVSRMVKDPDMDSPGRVRVREIPEYRLLQEGEGPYMQRLADHYASKGWSLRYHKFGRSSYAYETMDDLEIRSAKADAQPTPEALRKKAAVRFERQLTGIIQTITDLLVAGLETDPTQDSVFIKIKDNDEYYRFAALTPDSHLFREVARHFGENGWAVVHGETGIRFTAKAA